MRSSHQEAERLPIMARLDPPQRDTHLIETVITLHADLPPMLILQEGPLTLHLEESPTQTRAAIQQGMKDHHQTIVKPALATTILLFLVQNVHMLNWLVSVDIIIICILKYNYYIIKRLFLKYTRMTFHLVMLMLKYASHVSGWTMKWEVDLRNMEMHIVRGSIIFVVLSS